MRRPYPASLFVENGPKTIQRMLKLGKDRIPGLYVFLVDRKPLYVGISRSIVERVRSHILGRGHNDASLAFKMAKKNMNVDGERSSLMIKKRFKAAFIRAQRRLSGSQVSFVRIDDPVTRYLFEVYVAMKLRTGRWNTFETH